LLAIEVVPTKKVLPTRSTVPEAAGRVTVVVPAAADACSVVVPEVEPGNATLVIPVRARFAVVRFSATEVVPIKTFELPKIVDERVPPVRLEAVRVDQEAVVPSVVRNLPLLPV
jgi:hypothetical protein